MPTYGLQVITPATELPVSVEQVANYLRADLEAEYDEIERLLGLAIEECERYTGRALISMGYRLTLADWPRGLPEFASYPRNTKGAYVRTLDLPRCPITTIESVKYFPTGETTLATLSPSLYIAVTAYEPGLVYLKEGNEWPELSERPDAVQVEFTAGAASAAEVPKQVKQAVLLLARYYYAGGNPNERDSVADDLAKAHLLLDKLRVNGWSA